MFCMKKTVATLSLTAILLTGCASAGGEVTTAPANMEPVPTTTQRVQLDAQMLTTEKMRQIENDWFAFCGAQLAGWFAQSGDQFIDGVRYYGNYGGYDILFTPGTADTSSSVVIGNVTITHGKTFNIYAYKDGQFRDLKEVFLQGLINDADLERIEGIHIYHERKIYPLFTDPGEEEELYDRMKDAFLRQFVSEGSGTKKELSIVYYGDYDGAHVAFINGILYYTQAMTSETVAGFTFHYRTGQKLLVYFDGELMYLKEAYDKGVLSDEAVARLYRTYAKVPTNETE